MGTSTDMKSDKQRERKVKQEKRRKLGRKPKKETR